MTPETGNRGTPELKSGSHLCTDDYNYELAIGVNEINDFWILWLFFRVDGGIGALFNGI